MKKNTQVTNFWNGKGDVTTNSSYEMEKRML